MNPAARLGPFRFTRRSLLGRGAVGFASAAGATLLNPFRSLAQSSTPETRVAETKYGRIRGLRENGVFAFKGVPYAGSVSGTNRFKPAPPPTPWIGVRDAMTLGAPSIQPPGGTYGIDEPAPSEDCLSLNVWTPACDHPKRPVMFYCHGGGFTSGSAGAFFQDGANLAREYDVVVVETNHRLGLLGLLYLGEFGSDEFAGSGTQLLSDLRHGLEWVRDNIGQFGGDADNVTIFGESGGGWKVSCLLAMPSAANLFHKASIESGPMLHGLPQDRAAATTRAVLQQLGLGPNDWRKLLQLPAADLLKAQVAILSIPKSGPDTINLWPVLGPTLPHHPFAPAAPPFAANKPLIIGTCHDEANFFLGKDLAAYSLTTESLMERLTGAHGEHAHAIYDAYHRSRPEDSPTDLYIAIETAQRFRTDSITLAERKVAQQATQHDAATYMYVYTHGCDELVPGTQHKRGAYHSWDVAFRFDNLFPGGDGKPKSDLQAYLLKAIGSDEASRAASIQTAHNLSEMWATFARTGQPAAKGQPAWPAYKLPQRATMMLDANCRVVNDPEPLERRVWADLPRDPS
ncbi:para-nitrobenzyl esterase [Bryocella elongata]|uniref:Carboxylic ester hydrolase n=1 Tax=Bryocella elongata TaxID=863522 RepID=A0A1H5YNH5_9BACT|nr:carboxylesterase family protein [Bryocella elongata]SEG25699.1 para-nitrobenzyl esterase [Bryocella elongata]